MNKKERILAIDGILATRSKELETLNDPDKIQAITDEVKELVKERAQLQNEMLIEARNAFNAGTREEIPGQGTPKEVLEQRARDLKQGRTITLAALDILHTEEQSNVLSPTFKPVSPLADLVRIINAPGAESYKKGYMKTYGVGGYTAEGGNAVSTEPTWGYIEINKAKITAYTEVPEEFEKLAPTMYIPEILRNLSISIKKKLALEILKGAGTSNTLTGILTAAAATAIETSKDLELSTIDDTTLDKIIFTYGGDEEVEGSAVLILSKADLLAFANVKGTNEKKKLYDIDIVNHTINKIPYVINSNVTPLASASAGGYGMLYGSLQNYELTVFSQLEVSKSTDYKFKEGQVAYKASGFFGGNVVTFNGFLRVKKPAA